LTAANIYLIAFHTKFALRQYASAEQYDVTRAAAARRTHIPTAGTASALSVLGFTPPFEA